MRSGQRLTIEADGLDNVLGLDNLLLRCDKDLAALGDLPPLGLAELVEICPRQAAQHLRDDGAVDDLVCAVNDVRDELPDPVLKADNFDLLVLALSLLDHALQDRWVL